MQNDQVKELARSVWKMIHLEKMSEAFAINTVKAENALSSYGTGLVFHTMKRYTREWNARHERDQKAANDSRG